MHRRLRVVSPDALGRPIKEERVVPYKYICLAIAIFLCGSIVSFSIAADAPPAIPTCAVLAGSTAGLDSSPVVALLEAKLSQDSRIRLLERAEIARILAEHSLSLNLAESTAKSRREWGQLLRARLLVLLHARQVKEGKVIEASFVETRHGLSLGSERLVWDDRAEQIASLLARRISQVAATATADLKYVFAVPPFEAQDLSPDSLQYQSAYAQLVEEAVSRLPGVVTADLAHAAEVARELAVSEGETSVTRSLPYYLYGQHKMTGPTGNRTLSFHLELRRGQDMIASLNKDAVRPADAATFLRETCTELARKAIGSPAQPPANGQTTLEADLLEERCRAYRLVGEWESSIRMAEAALLLDSGRQESHAMTIDSYDRLASIWETRQRRGEDPSCIVSGNRLETAAISEPISAKAFIQYAFVATEHAWQLVHHRQLTAQEVRTLSTIVRRTSRAFYSHDYNWGLDLLGLAPLMRELLARNLNLVEYVLSNDRVNARTARPPDGLMITSPDFFRFRGSPRVEMTLSLADLISESKWATQDDWLRLIRTSIIAAERSQDPLALQWELVSAVKAQLLGLPVPIREGFLKELEGRQHEATRVSVEYLRGQLSPESRQLLSRFWGAPQFTSRPANGRTMRPATSPTVRRAGTTTRQAPSRQERNPSPPTETTNAGDSTQKVIFTPIPGTEAGDPRATAEQPIAAWLSLGSHRDVRVAGDRVDVMNGPAVMTRLTPPEREGWQKLDDVKWDGRYLWISHLDERGQLHVFEGTAWDCVAVIGEKDGLPAMERACKIAPLAPGRVCVVGCTGETSRPQAWIAVVELAGDKPSQPRKSVEVFFNARQAPLQAAGVSPSLDSLDCGFELRFVTPSRKGMVANPLLIVDRISPIKIMHRSPSPLLVDPVGRRVTLLPDEWRGWQLFVPGPDQLYALGYRREGQFLVPVLASARLPDTELRELLVLGTPGHEQDHFWNAIVTESSLHYVGKRWCTVDLAGPCLVRESLLEKGTGWPRLAWSDSYGLIILDQNVRRVTFSDDKEHRLPAGPSTNASPSGEALVGALVAWLPDRDRGYYDSQAFSQKIAVGDVIVAVNNRKISSASEFLRASANAENMPWSIEIVNELGRRTGTLKPGRLEVFVTDYATSYGPPLTNALRACREQQYTKARRLFEEAAAANLDCKSSDVLSVIYAQCVYYSGDTPKAVSILDEHLRQLSEEPAIMPWKRHQDAFEMDVPGPSQTLEGYLGLYLRTQCCQKYPTNISTAKQLPHYQQQLLRQYPAAVPEWLNLVGKDHASGRNDFSCVSLEHLFIAFGVLKMTPEQHAVFQYLVDTGLGMSCFNNMDKYLLQVGERELAARAWKNAKMPARGPIPSDDVTQFVIGIHAVAGQIKEARSMLKRLGPSPGPFLFASQMATEAFLIGWQDLAEDYAAYARRMLSQFPKEMEIQQAAFTILSHLPRPDIAELTKIYEQTEAFIKSDADPNQRSRLVYHLTSMNLTLLMLRGDYDAALAMQDRARQGSRPDLATRYEAALFLKDHAKTLTGDARKFLRTEYALRVPSGGWFLLTGDNRMGWASSDAAKIAEIPLPDPAWTPSYGPEIDAHRDPDAAEIIRCSKSGKTIVVLGSRRTIYLLDPDQRSWTQLTRFRFENRGSTHDSHELWMYRLSPALDDFAEFMLSKAESSREVVWPPVQPPSDARRASMMLCDGTWLVIERDSGQAVLDLSRLCATALGHPVEIYETSDLKADGPAYLYTSRGVLKWRRADNQIVPLPFPDRVDPAPVFPLTEGGERLKDKVVRLAVLPDAGGAIYQLDLVEGKLARDVGINECYPMTYWLQKPVEWNRQQVIDAVTKAGLPWPPPWLPMQTAESKPAKQ